MDADIQKKLDEFDLRLKKLETKRVNDVANGINDISDTADSTYSSNEQTMLDNIKATVNKILQNLRGQ